MTVVLLGPQRTDPTLADAARALGVSGPYALITAGWQEREPEDDELSTHLGGDTINLELHRRADDVFTRDPELADAHRTRQRRFRLAQDFYRIRLEYLLESAHVIANRSAPLEVLEEEEQTSIDALRVLDRHHQRQCDRIRREFRERWRPRERPIVAEHTEAIRERLSVCEAVAIAGGHVASLVNRLRLFGIADMLGDRPVLAWSAGAMAVTEQVVLFHDNPPNGVDVPQILDMGLGLVTGVVALPGPEQRLELEDAERVGRYARRFAPARCLALPRGAWVVCDEGGLRLPTGVVGLGADGSASPLEVAA